MLFVAEESENFCFYEARKARFASSQLPSNSSRPNFREKTSPCDPGPGRPQPRTMMSKTKRIGTEFLSGKRLRSGCNDIYYALRSIQEKGCWGFAIELMMLLETDAGRQQLLSNNARPENMKISSRFQDNNLDAVHDDIHMFVGKGHPIPDSDKLVRGHMNRLDFAGNYFLFWSLYTYSDLTLP